MTRDQTQLVEPAWIAGYRFTIEVIAWIAIYFAWGWIALVFAVAALSLFSVPGDKHVVLVRIPGPVRLLVESAVTVLGVAAAWQVWGPVAGAALLSGAVVLFTVSYRRWVWMWGR